MRFAALLNFIGNKIQNRVFGSYNSCYTQKQYEGIAIWGNCSGITDGSNTSEGLAEQCIGCPYLNL